MSNAVPESRGRRKPGSSGLRQRELGDSMLRIELGGSRLRAKEHRLSMPGVRGSSAAPGCETKLNNLRLGWREFVDFRQTKNDAAQGGQTQLQDPGN